MNIIKILKEEPLRNQLLNHPAVEKLKTDTLTRVQITEVVAQYYHLAVNFPCFLASLISHAKNIHNQTLISSILWQELGCGIAGKSHVEIYVESMKLAGLDDKKIVNSAPSQNTINLVQNYKDTAKNEFHGIGALYATETADLAIVSSIGMAITNATKISNLPWVDIHVKEEPDHVDSMDKAVELSLSDKEINVILEEAKKMWGMWINFFDTIGTFMLINDQIEILVQAS